QGVLHRPPLGAAGGFGVKPVLDHVQVEAGQVAAAEVVYVVIDQVVLVLVVLGRHLVHQLGGAGQEPPVQFRAPGHGQVVLDGVEVVQVAQHEADGVADLPVNLGHALHELGGHLDVHPVVHGGHPQAQDVGAVLFDDVEGVDDVAERLGHLAAFAIHHEAVGDDPLVGRLAPGGHRRQEGGLEPAPVLVGALNVEVRRPAQARPLGQHGGVAGARVEPYVLGIGLLAELPAPALGALGPRRHYGRCRLVEPGVGAFPPEQLHHAVQGFFHHGLVAAAAVEGGDGHAPDPLAADAPVGPVPYHAGDAGLAPR